MWRASRLVARLLDLALARALGWILVLSFLRAYYHTES